jgi:hypothetical protein
MGTGHDANSLPRLDSISELDSEEEVESGTWLEEMAEEVVGNTHDAPKQMDLHRLSRSSLKCHVSCVNMLFSCALPCACCAMFLA